MASRIDKNKKKTADWMTDRRSLQAGHRPINRWSAWLTYVLVCMRKASAYQLVDRLADVRIGMYENKKLEIRRKIAGKKE